MKTDIFPQKEEYQRTQYLAGNWNDTLRYFDAHIGFGGITNDWSDISAKFPFSDEHDLDTKLNLLGIPPGANKYFPTILCGQQYYITIGNGMVGISTPPGFGSIPEEHYKACLELEKHLDDINLKHREEHYADKP